MKTKTIFFLPLIVILTINLSQGQEKSDLIELDIYKFFIEKPIIYSKLFSDYRIIPLETNENSLVSVVQKIKFINDTLYIFDGIRTKTLYKFSKDGKYLGKICKVGKGPGEYQFPTDFDVDSKKRIIYIYDSGTRNLISYSSGGQYIKSMKTTNRSDSFVKSDKGFHFYDQNPSPENAEAKLLYFYNHDGLVLSKNLSFMKYGLGLKNPERTMGGNFFKSKNDIKFFMPLCDTIFSISGDKIKPFMVLNTKSGKLTKGDLMGTLDKPSVSDRPSVMNFQNISNYCEFNNLASFKFGLLTWCLYNFKTQKLICSSSREDDLTYMFSEPYMVGDQQFGGVIYQNRFSKLQDAIRSGKVKIPSKEKERILKLTEQDNPLVILYNIRKGEIQL